VISIASLISLCLSSDEWLSGQCSHWVSNYSPLSDSRSGRQLRRHDLVSCQDMKNSLPAGEQIIRNYAPMASPPDRFRAHDSALSRMTEFSQLGKTTVKGVSHGVVGIIVKALVLPECIDR
jgi:hypothetical protein